MGQHLVVYSWPLDPLRHIKTAIKTHQDTIEFSDISWQGIHQHYLLTVVWDNLDQYVTLNCHTIPLQLNWDQYVTLKLQPVHDIENFKSRDQYVVLKKQF